MTTLKAIAGLLAVVISIGCAHQPGAATAPIAETAPRLKYPYPVPEPTMTLHQAERLADRRLREAALAAFPNNVAGRQHFLAAMAEQIREETLTEAGYVLIDKVWMPKAEHLRRVHEAERASVPR